MADAPQWRTIAASQAGIITRAQLATAGVDRWAVRHRIDTERWVEHTPTVVGTTTGPASREQLMWIGVLHAGPRALVGDLSAAEELGLKNWHRDLVTVLIPPNLELKGDVDGVTFRRTRRPLDTFRSARSGLPLCRLEPAILHFAAYQRSPRTAEGVLAAAVQQQLTDPSTLLHWVEEMRPLRWARRFRAALAEIAGGAGSVAELDVARLCREHGLRRPVRQVRRRDADGRLRFTDCEWRLRDGRTLVLEVDGGFHRDAEHWEEDIARERALTTPDRIIVRCTARELRDERELLARDLRLLGVPPAA